MYNETTSSTTLPELSIGENDIVNTNADLVINTQGLTKTFKGVDALSSLNLTVQKNSIFGFLGPNGAGKSTTIKLLLGLSRPRTVQKFNYSLIMYFYTVRVSFWHVFEET